MKQPTKPWYQSSTVWFNALTLAASFATFALADSWVQSNPQVVAALGSFLAFANLILRFRTHKSIRPQDQPDKQE